MTHISEPVLDGQAAGRYADFPPRTVIIDEGEPARSVYRIVSGQVMLSRFYRMGAAKFSNCWGQGLFSV